MFILLNIIILFLNFTLWYLIFKFNYFDNYFFFNKSWLYKILSFFAFISTILLSSIAFYGFENSYQVLSAICMGYFVSFLFYYFTSVKDKIDNDKISITQLKILAYGIVMFDEIENEIKNIPCKTKNIYDISTKNCILKCIFRKNQKCTIIPHINYYIIFLERKLSISISIIENCKPELIGPFSVMLGELYKLKFYLDNKIEIDFTSFNNIKELYDIFTDTNISKEKLKFNDRQVIINYFKMYYKESQKEIKIGVPLSFIGIKNNKNTYIV